MNRNYKRWTQDEKDTASKLLSQFTIRQVSKKMNRSIGSIKEIASHELKGNYCRSKIFREEEGLLQSHIAKRLGVTRSHINNWIKMNNLAPRKCGKKGFHVIEEDSLYQWLRQGYVLLPMLNPEDTNLRQWICKNRNYYIQKYTSASYVRHITCVTRGALDNWVRNFNFPKPIKKIGKIGLFYERQEVVRWARNYTSIVSNKKIALLNSYDNEMEYLNQKMQFKCME